jgi:hypothetical protein
VTAANTFAALKIRGISSELITEYVKDWAWQQRQIGPLDQFYLFGKQLHRESKIYSKVHTIVTDSPIGVSAYYANRYAAPEIGAAIKMAHQAVRAQKLTRCIDVWLNRVGPYQQEGRYETEEEALDVDRKMKHFLTEELGITLHTVDAGDIETLIKLATA